jgi:hypothetical protein
MKPLAPPVVRPATREDLAKFYKSEKMEHTVMAKVGLARGRMYACWGLAWTGGKPFIFMDVKPLARRYKVRMMKEAYKLLSEARQRGIHTIFAARDFDEDGSGRLLDRLGFKPTMIEGIYKWQH